MAIDASIYGQLRQPEPSFNPLAEMAQFQQLQGAQNQNKLFGLQFAEKERAQQDQVRLRGIYAGGAQGQALENQLLQGGYPDQALKLGKDRRDNLKLDVDTGKTQFETADAKRRVAMQHLLSFENPQDAMASLAAAADIPPEMKQQLMRSMPQDPVEFMKFQIRSARALATPEQQAAGMEPKMMNAGGAWVNTNPLAGPTGQGAPNAIDITQSADNAATQGTALAGQRSTAATAAAGQQRMAADAAAGRGVTMRGQNMVDARAVAAAGGAPAGAGDDPTQAALNKKFGKPEAGRRWKADGSLEPIPGGSADLKTINSDIGKGTVNDVVASLRGMYDQLDAAGGITNPDKGGASNLTAGIASSGPGQAAGRLFGTQNQSARNTVAQQRPLLLQAIMKATGMSAKQMDSNAELKLYLATATDPTLDVAANRRALDMIETLYGKAGGTASPGKPGKAVKRTGTSNGRKVIEYTDGSIEYAD